MRSLTEEIKASLRDAVRGADSFAAPYPHWLVRDVFPEAVFQSLKTMRFPVVDIAGVSGTREAHNAERVYFSGTNLREFAACGAAAEAFQDAETVELFNDAFAGNLGDTFVRIEYAQDTDGFWLKPHTDIGVKMFTMLIYMSDDPKHADLGTDIYADPATHAGRTPFLPNTAMIFIPSDRTWHGFERRPINGVRRSMIVNYVTDAWKARDQLAFPAEPVLARAA